VLTQYLAVAAHFIILCMVGHNEPGVIVRKFLLIIGEGC
jgi:hypothetical protein